MNTDRFLTIPAEECHDASRRGRYMSSHNLGAFRESPELYRREIRRIREKAERDAALYEQRLEREAREVEERCAGKSVEEQVRIREEFCARLEVDMKRHEVRVREIEETRKAAEEARSKEYEMSPGTKGALLFMAGAAVGSIASRSRRSGRWRSLSRGCGCECDECLEGRHEDCDDDCELW